MKRLPEILALASGLIGTAAWASPAQPMPTPFPEERYEQMCVKSPFAVASATTDPKAAAAPGFATNLYVDGVAHIGQTDFVAIKSRDPNMMSNALFLAVGETTTDGMQVVRINWSENRGGSTVEVRKQNQKAVLEFDEAQMTTTPKPAIPVFQPPRTLPPNVRRFGAIQVITAK